MLATVMQDTDLFHWDLKEIGTSQKLYINVAGPFSKAKFQRFNQSYVKAKLLDSDHS